MPKIELIMGDQNPVDFVEFEAYVEDVYEI